MPDLKIPFVIDSLEVAPQPLRPFFQKQEDGKYLLQVEGDPPGFVAAEKLDSFRSSNRSLNAAKADLETKLKQFDGIDAEQARDALAKLATVAPEAARATALETQLKAEQAAHARTQVRNAIGFEFLKFGGQEKALDFIASRAPFTFENGKLTTKEFSATSPGEPLSVSEWMSQQLVDAPFAFKPSRGGGAIGGGGATKRIVDRHDPLSVGRNLEAIARGDATVG